MNVTAVVLAGQRPGTDPLAAHFGGSMKAMVPLAGEPMVRRPVRALIGSGSIGQVVVLAQQTQPLKDALAGLPRVDIRASKGTIAETILGLCKDPGTQWPLLVTTADHALLDPAMIDEFCAVANASDLAVGVVQRATLEQRFPQSKRTWLAFRDEQVTGANLFWLGSPDASRAVEKWRAVEQDRKKAWRLIALLGPWWLIKSALRLASVDEVAERISTKLGLKMRIVRLTDPLAGIDVDKIADHRLVEAILAGRA